MVLTVDDQGGGSGRNSPLKTDCEAQCCAQTAKDAEYPGLECHLFQSKMKFFGQKFVQMNWFCWAIVGGSCSMTMEQGRDAKKDEKDEKDERNEGKDEIDEKDEKYGKDKKDEKDKKEGNDENNEEKMK